MYFSIESSYNKILTFSFIKWRTDQHLSPTNLCREWFLFYQNARNECGEKLCLKISFQYCRTCLWKYHFIGDLKISKLQLNRKLITKLFKNLTRKNTRSFHRFLWKWGNEELTSCKGSNSPKVHFLYKVLLLFFISEVTQLKCSDMCSYNNVPLYVSTCCASVWKQKVRQLKQMPQHFSWAWNLPPPRKSLSLPAEDLFWTLASADFPVCFQRAASYVWIIWAGRHKHLCADLPGPFREVFHLKPVRRHSSFERYRLC